MRNRGPTVILLRAFGAALVAVLALPVAAQPVFTIGSGDRLGLIDREGKIILPPEFSEVKPGRPLILATKGYKTAFFDYSGRMVIEPQSEITQPFVDGVAPRRMSAGEGKSKYGYVDASGKTAIAPVYDHVEGFVDGRAVVGIADAWGVVKYGAIDRNGKLVVAATYDKVFAPSGGVVRAQMKDRPHRLFDRSGRDITPAGIDFVGIQAEGMVRVWQGRQQGFMTTSGELAIAPRFEGANEFREGFARVRIAGKYGYIDKRGTQVIEARFDTAEDFSDGLALAKEGGKSVFVDKQGKVVLQPQADRVYPFTEGLAVAKVGPKYGYIDKRGKFVIEPQFSFARAFHNGLAGVSMGRASGYIRPDGQFVWRDDGAPRN